jgi:magnesium transporter
MTDELLSSPSGEAYDPREIAERLGTIDPDDGAVVLEFLPVKTAGAVLSQTAAQPAGEILHRMDPVRAAKLISRIDQGAAAKILSAMAPDDRVDLLERLTPQLHDDLLRQMEAAQAAEARQLEQYPPETAGGIMTTEVTALSSNFTVEQAIAELRRIFKESQQLFYVYVVDENRRLVGVLSMRDLILADPHSTLPQIMISSVKAVPATMDQDEVSRLMRSSRYLALPVVDDQSRLLGIVTLDDVVDVIEEEATEDVQRMFGAGAEERLGSSWQFSFSRRIWWLEVNLATAFLAGLVVAMFGSTIGRFSVLAIFIPIVSSMGSNAGAQAMSVVIRGIAHGRTDRILLRRILTRESIVGALSGLAIGATTAAIAMVWQYHHGLILGAVVGISLVITQILACISGAIIPFVMKRLGFDPAQSATIFITTITDVAGFVSLLGLATVCQAWMR